MFYAQAHPRNYKINQQNKAIKLSDSRQLIYIQIYIKKILQIVAAGLFILVVRPSVDFVLLSTYSVRWLFDSGWEESGVLNGWTHTNTNITHHQKISKTRQSGSLFVCHSNLNDSLILVWVRRVRCIFFYSFIQTWCCCCFVSFLQFCSFHVNWEGKL